jgi:CTP-dependent riboflavin kinase
MSRRKYWLDRKEDNERLLKAALKPGFSIKQTTANGETVDMTEEHRRRLRQSIEDYQRAADMVRDDD